MVIVLVMLMSLQKRLERVGVVSEEVILEHAPITKLWLEQGSAPLLPPERETSPLRLPQQDAFLPYKPCELRAEWIHAKPRQRQDQHFLES